jgi:hypothetical protein
LQVLHVLGDTDNTFYETRDAYGLVVGKPKEKFGGIIALTFGKIFIQQTLFDDVGWTANNAAK